ncbi:MAG TPA: adenylyltransferase/cytidyltransferase family protein [Patescibacteria group bacterium]|nr:adenylyltransferase/cytidyltransferase family protein [Patescibacteria group bacterium]
MRNKIKTLEELKKIIEEHKKNGKKITTTSGSFDLLHIGHIYVLESAKAFTDILIVFLNNDSSIKGLKGPNRPIVSEKERAEMLSSLECVDYIVIFEENNPLNLIKEIKPDFHVKGGTFDPERVRAERELVESWGGRHVTLPTVEGYSTTNLINKIIETYNQ